MLPLADLPVAPFFICMATVIHRGDLVRTLISGVIVMITVLLIATQFAPYFTEMALKGGFSLPVKVRKSQRCPWAICSVGRFLN